MRVSTIGNRLRNELKSADIQSAGLRYAYYPAPSSLNDGPAALIFLQSATVTNMNEQVWEFDVLVQLLISAKDGRLAAEINALEPLVEPITDHFAPDTDAFHLRVPSESGIVHHCYPVRFDLSQNIRYAGHDFTGITATFNVKTHRYAGEA